MTIDFLGKVLFVRPESDLFYNSTIIENESRESPNHANNSSQKSIQVTCRDGYESKYQTTTVENGEAHTPMQEELHLMRMSLSHIRSRLHNTSSADAHQIDLAKQWKDVALVIDRLFFLLYIFLIVVSLSTLFPRRQY